MGNNTKLLTKDEFEYINNKYIFKLVNDKVEVSFKNIKRKTLHNKNETFRINVKPLKRLFIISPEIINLWIELKFVYTLLEVMQASNLLKITYQEANLENVKRILKENLI